MNSPRSGLQILVVVILLSAAYDSRAQDPIAYNQISFLTEKTGFGARAMGLGGAFLAVADDYSAIYWNPAGLGLLNYSEVFASIAHNNKGIDTRFLGVTGDNTQSKTTFDALGFAYSVDVLRGSLVFAVGYNRVHDFNSFFGYNAFNPGQTYMDIAFAEPVVPNSLTQDETVEIEGNLSQFTVSGAYEAAENLFLGIALNLWTGENNYNQLYKETDLIDIYNILPNDFFGYVNDLEIDTEISGFDVVLGALYRFSPQFRLGVTVNTPRFVSLSENWSTFEDVVFDDGEAVSEDDNGTFKYEVLLPFEFGVGLSYAFSNGLVSGEVRYTDWSQFRFRDDIPIEGLSKGDANRNIKRILEGVFSPKVGLELSPMENVKLRTGFELVPSPLASAKSENDLRFISFGFGLVLGGTTSIDVAYRRGWWETDTVSDFNGLPVEEKHVDHKVFSTISYKF